ncbi:hypothetical protein [Chryseobacterium scophthalmum]|uniref:hypothetical protein n=1 Tax=Chryseobacterium scophthalmum TaxID=59733 RepID=UPI001AEBEDBB|nr:hypothetical protein [Chryseobacterium scophthalmum]
MKEGKFFISISSPVPFSTFLSLYFTPLKSEPDDLKILTITGDQGIYLFEYFILLFFQISDYFQLLSENTKLHLGDELLTVHGSSQLIDVRFNFPENIVLLLYKKQNLSAFVIKNSIFHRIDNQTRDRNFSFATELFPNLFSILFDSENNLTFLYVSLHHLPLKKTPA